MGFLSVKWLQFLFFLKIVQEPWANQQTAKEFQDAGLLLEANIKTFLYHQW